MHASATTWSFKTQIITMLEQSGLGFDTRHHYYQQQFPDMDHAELARLICDPMEYYDKDWPAYRDQRLPEYNEELAATEFMLALDNRFRNQAQTVIACYDEAGFGSGVNAMIFLQAGKPLLGFYNRQSLGKTINLSNILQLGIAFPELVTLHEYQHPDEIPGIARAWLERISAEC
jgi:hypothetical protein